MGYTIRWLTAGVLTLLLSGCLGPPTIEAPPPAPPASAPVDPRAQAGEDAAMLALLDQSEAALEAGRYAESISVLERALRIEPRRGDLWTALARAHLRNDEPQRAIQFAERALSLSRNRVDWQRSAWLVIADAKAQLGDEAEARTIRELWQIATG